MLIARSGSWPLVAKVTVCRAAYTRNRFQILLAEALFPRSVGSDSADSRQAHPVAHDVMLTGHEVIWDWMLFYADQVTDPVNASLHVRA